MMFFGVMVGTAIGWGLAVLKLILSDDLEKSEASHWKRRYNRLYEQMEFEKKLKNEVR